MYPSARSYADQYRKIGASSAILEASPHKLVQLLLEGVSSRLRLAHACLERNDIPGKGKAITRACEIISHLATTLDLEKGGDLAQNLLGIYDYSLMRLTEANLNNDAVAIEEVLSLISQIEAAWSELQNPATSHSA